MAKEGLVRADEGGQPLRHGKRTWRAEDGSACIELTADFSPIGLPSAVPITVRTQDDTAVEWSLGRVRVATIPAEFTPEEAGDAITRARVTAAYRHGASRNRPELGR